MHWVFCVEWTKGKIALWTFASTILTVPNPVPMTRHAFFGLTSSDFSVAKFTSHSTMLAVVTLPADISIAILAMFQLF